jgi:hypothetical protein
MDKCKEITFCAKELLKTHRIHLDDNNKDKVIALLSNYIDLLIFNIVAVVSIICANIGVKKVISQHIQYLSKYIDKRCLNKKASGARMSGRSAMSGGSAFNTAAFFGAVEPRYSAENAGTNVQTIDFASGIARNALPMSGGSSSGGGGSSRRSVTPSCAKLDKIILKKINNVFKFFNIKVEKEAVAHIKLKYDLIIKDLYMCIKKIKGDITASKVALIIKKSKIMKKKKN